MNLWKNRNWNPMLLQEEKEPFDSSEYLYELKMDGNRAIVFANSKKVQIYNRHHQEITHLYPELQKIKEIVTNNTIFDGEIVSFENGLPSFTKLQERAHLKNKLKINHQALQNPIIFFCFDILYNHKDLTKKTLEERKKILDAIDENEVFVKSNYINKEGINFFEQIKKVGLEGIVAKKRDSIYEINTRSYNWLKIKNLKVETFWIGGYIENEKSPIISLLLGEKKRNKLNYVGNVILAKKSNLYQNIKKTNRIANPFNITKEKAIYIEPINRCSIEYIERTKNNHLRQPKLRK